MNKVHPASFKDPAGFVLIRDELVYRQVNQCYQPHYDQLINSGLYQELVEEGLLIAHKEIPENLSGSKQRYKTLLPAQLPFISYPYEWSFEQLRDAALLTLSIMRKAIRRNMILKDATPFNIQFVSGKPLFIDTLSFENYTSTEPWVAYRQFCETFLFPLYLEHYLRIDCIPWLKHYLTGIPVAETARLLPWKSRWNLGVRLHVLLQRRYSGHVENTASSGKQLVFSRQKLENLLQHLEAIISKLAPGYPDKSTWSNYYEETILGKAYLQEKEQLVRQFCAGRIFGRVLDLGANDGHFTRILARAGSQVIAADSDSRCINTLYETLKQHPLPIYPLVLDLSNPSPALGFAHTERMAFSTRAKADLVLALALIHHLVIGRNISLPVLAGWLAGLGPELIIEFIPREDEKVLQLLAARKDVFQDYDQAGFELAFTQFYQIEEQIPISGTARTLYRLRRKDSFS